MDTGYLTDKTYKAILVEAERFNPDLTMCFGLLSGEFEEEFHRALKRILENISKL